MGGGVADDVFNGEGGDFRSARGSRVDGLKGRTTLISVWRISHVACENV